MVAACSLVPFVLASAACVDTSEARSPWQRWTTLQLKVKSSPLFRGRVQLRWSEGASGRRLDTTTTASFLGATVARTKTRSLFDPVTGKTTEYRSFSSKKGRIYRFGEQGYTVEKLRRNPDGDDADPWEVYSTEEFSYPESDAGGDPVRLLDYYGMLLHVGDLGLDAPGDETTLHVATSKGPQAYRIRVHESRTGERTFLNLATGEKTTLPARELRLTIDPADPATEAGFLKMKGPVEVWVEARTKTPLEIAGDAPKIPGRVRLVLSAMG
jgi:hypothetical protein